MIFLVMMAALEPGTPKNFVELALNAIIGLSGHTNMHGIMQTRGKNNWNSVGLGMRGCDPHSTCWGQSQCWVESMDSQWIMHGIESRKVVRPFGTKWKQPDVE